MPETGERRAHYRAAGQGPPALLLHCALAHSGAFAAVMGRLGEGLAMRALDLPGHGRTPYEPARDFQVQATEDALASLAETGPAHLIGHSFGGTVALRLAAGHPDLVRSLVLIEPVAFAFLADAGHPGYARERAANAPFQTAAEVGDWAAAGAAFLGRWGAPEASGPQAAYIRERLPLVMASAPALYDTPAPRLRLGDIAGLTAPVLLLAGSDSPRVVHDILDVIAGTLPQARRLTVAGAGHMLPVTHPAEVSDAIRDFLAREDAEEIRDLGLGRRPVADEPR